MRHGPDALSSLVSVSEQGLKQSLGRLETLEENCKEFQDVVQAFYDTLDADQNRIRIVRVSSCPVLLACGLCTLFFILGSVDQKLLEVDVLKAALVHGSRDLDLTGGIEGMKKR